MSHLNAEGTQDSANIAIKANAALPFAQKEISSSNFSKEQILHLVRDSLEGSKAEDISVIDLADKSSLGDYMIVASGRSHRHVSAVADHLIRAIKKSGLGSPRVEGLPACDWVLVDSGDVIVHLFRPEVREFYNIEKMWSQDRPEELSVS